MINLQMPMREPALAAPCSGPAREAAASAKSMYLAMSRGLEQQPEPARGFLERCLAQAGELPAGFEDAEIVAGLASFVSDARSNPLRTNLFEVRGITVIADYAHNPAAYAALAEMARTMTAGAVIGVVTSPGDRRDEELRHTGQACGAGFDRLVVYESASRGRPYGEAAALIRQGALSASTDPASIDGVDDRVLALRRALSLCLPGDVLVYCGTALSALVEAMPPTDPQSAQTISSQADL